MSSYSLPPPFSLLGSSASSDGSSAPYGARANFALVALVLLVAGLLLAIACLIRYHKRLAPKYGQRLKYNVVTGKAVLRDAPLRTLPTAEEARKQQLQEASGVPDQPAQSRFSVCCPAVDWCCPPCLLHGTCFDWLWCGPRWCCGQASFSEWMFARVYRQVAFRWLALAAQVAIGGCLLLALGLDQWSWDRSFSGGPDGAASLHVGLVEMRADGYTSNYSCGNAGGTDLVQCGTFRIAAGFVFAFGIAACLIMALCFVYSAFLVFSARSATPRLWLLATAGLWVITAIVLLWPLSPHLVLTGMYDSSLSLGPSWGIIFIAWFLTLIWTTYLERHITCTSLEESGDLDAQKEAAAELKRLAAEEDRHRNHMVLMMTAEQLEREERRIEAATWTKEGYGASQPPSPRAAYDLAMQGRPYSTVQRPWHANEPIPLARPVEPTWAELEAAARERAQWDERVRLDLARRRAEREQVQGPYTTSPPRFVDPDELAREREQARAASSAGQRPEEDMLGFDPRETGLSQRDALRSAYGFDGQPISEHQDAPYTYHSNATAPVRIHRDQNSLDHALLRAVPGGGLQSPSWNGQYGPDGVPQLNPPEQYASGSPLPAGSPATSYSRARADIAAAANEENKQVDEEEDIARPRADLGQFRVLSAAYVQDSLQLDEAELDMLMAQRRPKRAQKPMLIEEEQEEKQPLDAEEVSLQPPPPSSNLPLTPALHRATSREPAASQRFGGSTVPHGRLPPLQASGGLARHPFEAGSPSRGAHAHTHGSPSLPLALPSEHDARVYHYGDQISFRPSYAYPPMGAAQSSRGGGDLRFTSTYGGALRPLGNTQTQQQGYGFAYTQGLGASQMQQSQQPWHGGETLSPRHHQQQQQQQVLGSPHHHQQQQQPSPSPRFALNQSGPGHFPRQPSLSVQIDSSNSDPLNRTIPTPMPVHVSYDPYSTGGAFSPSGRRQQQLAPQTPRVLGDADHQRYF